MSVSDEKFKLIVRYFVNRLEAGVAPWLRPYAINKVSGSLPRNCATNTPYRGANVITLWMVSDLMGFGSNKWLTYKQANDLGGTVKAKSKGTQVFYFAPSEQNKNADDDASVDEAPKSWFMRTYTVFNLDQIEGVKDPDEAEPLLVDNQIRNARVENFLHLTRAPFREGKIPAYVPRADIIELPRMEMFRSVEDYYSTAFHEIIHWTGHEKRMDRLRPCKYGDLEYSFEELVAEVGSAFLCSHFGVPMENAGHPEYLGFWVKALKEKPSILWRAGHAAQRSFEYLMHITEAARIEDDKHEAA